MFKLMILLILCGYKSTNEDKHSDMVFYPPNTIMLCCHNYYCWEVRRIAQFLLRMMLWYWSIELHDSGFVVRKLVNLSWSIRPKISIEYVMDGTSVLSILGTEVCIGNWKGVFDKQESSRDSG